MDDTQTTRPSLLARVRNSEDREAWAEFVEVYSPFVYGFMRRRGLQDADAADVTQEVLRTVFHGLETFEHGQRTGSFRRWLVSIARSRLSDFLSQQSKRAVATGGTTALELLGEHPRQDDEDEALEHEYQKCLFQWAVEKIRGKVHGPTWQAFWQTHMEGKSSKDVAEGLGMTVEAVYMARSRVLARLRTTIQRVEA